MTEASGSEPGGGGGGGIATQLGDNWQIVTTWAMFAALSVEGPAGVWTYDVPILVDGTIPVPVGERLISGENGFLTSFQWSQAQIVGDVDGDLISGPVVINNIAVKNKNTGAAAWDVHASSFFGRTLIFGQSTTSGIRGLRVSNVLGAAAVPDSAHISGPVLISYEVGGVIGAFTSSNFSAIVDTSGSLGFVIGPTTVIAAGLVTVNLAVAISSADEYAVAISGLIKRIPGAVLHFSGCSNSGRQDHFFRQLPGDLDVDEVGLVAAGNPSVADWAASISVVRVDAEPGHEVSVSLPAGPGPVTIPYENGVDPATISVTASTRWRLVKNPSDTSDWYMEYRGLRGNAQMDVSWRASFDRNSGSGYMQTQAMVRRAEPVYSAQLDDGGVFTDQTDEAQNPTIDDVELLPATITIGDATYFGGDPAVEMPAIVKVLISQSGIGAYTVAWETFNGATWVAATGVVDGTLGFKAATGEYDVYHVPQVGDTATTVNGANGYYLRARVTATGMSQQPLGTQVFTYTSYEVIGSTVTPSENTSGSRRNASGTGPDVVDRFDRVNAAMQNGVTSAAQAVRVFSLNQECRVLP